MVRVRIVRGSSGGSSRAHLSCRCCFFVQVAMEIFQTEYTYVQILQTVNDVRSPGTTRRLRT